MQDKNQKPPLKLESQFPAPTETVKAAPESGANQQSSKKDYFNILCYGYAELVRVRDVEIKKKAGTSVLHADLNVYNGKVSDPKVTRFTVRVMGSAAEAVNQLRDAAIDKNRKVIVAFHSSDLAPENYTYTDRKDGKERLANVVRARLLKIQHASIDGETVIGEPAEVGEFYDTVTYGVGYLNYIHTSQGASGKEFRVAQIVCLSGPKEDPAKVSFSALVTNTADEAVDTLKGGVEGKMTVFCGFTFNGGYAESYTDKDPKGEERLNSRIRTRLAKISWATVDKEKVIAAPVAESETPTVVKAEVVGIISDDEDIPF